MIRTLAAVVVLALGAAPAMAESVCPPAKLMPPASARHEPTVPYRIFYLPVAKGMKACRTHRADFVACSYEIKGAWSIIIDQAIPLSDVGCVLAYEKAHLPPNNWQDAPWEKSVAGR